MMNEEVDKYAVAHHPHWYPLGSKTCYFCDLRAERDRLKDELRFQRKDNNFLKDNIEQLKAKITELKARLEKAEGALRISIEKSEPAKFKFIEEN